MTIGIKEDAVLKGGIKMALIHGSIYKLSFKKLIKNSFVFVSATLPKQLLLILIAIVILSVQFIPKLGTQFLLLSAIIIGFFPLLILIWFLFSCSLFDEHINREHFPELYKKGLWDMEHDNEIEKVKQNRLHLFCMKT